MSLAVHWWRRPVWQPDKIKILREAFNKAVNDPALLAEAEKRRLDMDPASGEESRRSPKK